MIHVARELGRTGARDALCRGLACALLGAALIGYLAPVAASERIEVTEPYLELRTGPGLGYPVTFVVQRGDAVDLLLRRTDWIKLRHPASGREGWAHREALDRLLAGGGPQKSLRDELLESALQRRVELGGAFGSLKSQPATRFTGAVRLLDTLAVQGTLGQVYAGWAGTEYWTIGLVSEPWSDQRWSPFFAIAGGRINGMPAGSNATTATTAATVNAKLGSATLGLKRYLNDHVTLQLDYTIHTSFIGGNRIREQRAPHFGLTYLF